MKALLVILLFYATYCLAEDSKIVLKKYLKKVSPGHKQYINIRRFVKTEPVHTKKANINKDYTVFQPLLPNEGHVNVPDSPYFRYESNDAPKSRVKKVLPQYMSERKKRSTEDEKIIENDKAGKNAEVDNKADVAKEKKFKRSRHVKHGSKGRRLKAQHRNKKNKHLKRKTHQRSPAGKTRHRNLRETSRHRNKKQLKHNIRKIKHGRQLKGKKQHKSYLKHLNKKLHVPKKITKKMTKDARRLISGKDVLIEEYPYVVSIQKNKEHWCTGALLNPRLVITTANCLWKANTISRLRVRVGSRYVDRGGEMAKIQEVMKHPYWGIRGDPDNDVALMLLDRNVRFSDSVHGVDLPNRAMMPAFDDAWVTSWGTDRRDGVYDERTLTLQAYHARLMSREKCNNVTQRFGIRVSENFVCLAQTGKRAPCTRDSGAPAVSDGVLWGLASWGIRKLCGTERFPAMFSYLASPSNMDFIANATHVLMADQRYYPFVDRPRYPRMRVNSTQ